MNVAPRPQAPAAGIDLAQLLAGRAAAPHLVVGALTSDSRAATPGDAFVALPGARHHGLEFAAQAARAGAAAILWDASRPVPPALPAAVAGIPVAHLERDVGELGDRAYGEPSARAAVTGVTGTNGKTTCAWLLAQAWAEAGAYVGTLGAGVPGRLLPGSHTTPDCLALHRTLAELVESGAREVAIEVSSHALTQDRTAGVRLPVVAFTNLSRDHLDFHETMAAYGAAKERVLHARDVGRAVLNLADPFGRDLSTRLPNGVELYAIQPDVAPAGPYLRAESVRIEPGGMAVDGSSHLGRFVLHSPLRGAFNVQNLMVVLGVLLARNVPLAEAVERVSRATAPPGRMEAVALPQGATALIDYAHTPDALANVLGAARAYGSRQLWCVFGCGGERDPGKRGAMGRIAEALADRVIVTDDNPRGEPPSAIVTAILAGMRAPQRALVEHDRRRAITTACAGAAPGDVVLIAGKGHEDYQISGGLRRPFSDRAVVNEYVRGGQ
jgi:UDP-N-acetylmuramoyl-L-alanyl-D-glutamate--2,6-diaminopimelate ligase